MANRSNQALQTAVAGEYKWRAEPIPAMVGHRKSGPSLQVCREAAKVDVLDCIMERLAPLASLTAHVGGL